MVVVFTRRKVSHDIGLDECTRVIPDAGALALIIDGHDPAIIAAALDTTASSVKHAVSLLMEDLLRQVNLLSQAKGQFPGSHKSFPSIAKWLQATKRCTWEDLLTTRELTEVLEVRAYFRAFQNSVVHKGENHDVQTHSCA